MCKKTKYCNTKIDLGIRKLVKHINEYMPCKTLGSCCGHGKYPMTIIVQEKNGLRFELLSDKLIPRTRRFYKKDKKGHYYVPEISEEKK